VVEGTECDGASHRWLGNVGGVCVPCGSIAGRTVVRADALPRAENWVDVDRQSVEVGWEGPRLLYWLIRSHSLDFC
jgi:hypothetical protein